jgi:hypothetical protein
MAINPADITTVRVDQLASEPITLTSLLPHQVGTDLKQDTVQALVDLVATAIGAGSGVGYLPISVTDGQQLPAVPTDPSFFLCGAGTYLNINGFPNVICTGELNAVMSLSDHWELAVEIPIVAEVGVQTVTGSAVDNTDPINPVVNITTQTLQQTMELGRSYIQTVGDYQYVFRFLTSLMQLHISNSTTQIGGILQFTDSNSQFSFSDALIGIVSGITADLTYGVTILTSDDSTSENFVNQLIVPIKTAESGVSSFSIPNNKPAGDYDLVVADETGNVVIDGDLTVNGLDISFNVNSLSIGLVGEKAFNTATNQTEFGDLDNINGNATKFLLNSNDNLGYFDSVTHDTKIGINTDTPTCALDVVGDIKVNGNLVLTRIVVSSNTNAVNDTNYTVVANATFTDPSPVEGKGYVVFVRNGTATIGGVGYTEGRLVYRVFHSGGWSSVVYVDKVYVDTALALKVNKNRFIYQPKVSVTGVTGETNICSFKIDGGSYESTDAFKFDFTMLKSTTAATSTYKVYVGLTSGARTNQIMSSAITGANRTGDVNRRYNIDDGNLDTSVIFTANAQSGLSGINALNTPVSVNMANDLWITITANPTVSGESHGVLMASITPLK